jgi:transposase
LPGRSGALSACCQSVGGGPIRQGAIQRAVDRVSEALIPYDAALAEPARRTRVNYRDETGWYQPGGLAWLWGMVHTTVALFKVQASRSQAAFEALVEAWAGLLGSAGETVDQHWVPGRQTCLAHLIRRARGLAARPEPELAGFGRRVRAELQRLGPWAQAPPPAGSVQTW